MPSLSCVVVANDFSAFSECVGQRAARLAKRHHAEPHALHPRDRYPRSAKSDRMDITGRFGGLLSSPGGG